MSRSASTACIRCWYPSRTLWARRSSSELPTRASGRAPPCRSTGASIVSAMPSCTGARSATSVFRRRRSRPPPEQRPGIVQRARQLLFPHPISAATPSPTFAWASPAATPARSATDIAAFAGSSSSISRATSGRCGPTSRSTTACATRRSPAPTEVNHLTPINFNCDCNTFAPQVRPRLENAGRGRGSRRLWPAIRRYLSADARSRPAGTRRIS